MFLDSGLLLTWLHTFFLTGLAALLRPVFQPSLFICPGRFIHRDHHQEQPAA